MFFWCEVGFFGCVYFYCCCFVFLSVCVCVICMRVLGRLICLLFNVNPLVQMHSTHKWDLITELYIYIYIYIKQKNKK